MPTPTPRQGKPMDGLTRRSLLIGSGVVGAVALAAGATRIRMSDVVQSGATDTLPSGSPILVMVTLYGGNDWLNTVVPYADSAYYAARPGISHAAGTTLPLDQQLGLAPALGGIASEYAAGRVAVVRGVGYPQPDRSHFRSMDIWQTASPGKPADTGWLGRWLDAAGGDPLAAINVGEILPPMLVGRTTAAAALALGGTALPAGSEALMAKFAAVDPADSPAAAAVCQSYQTHAKVQQLAKGAAAGAAAKKAGKALRAQVETVAECIKAGAPTRVYGVSLGGFDTHADEITRQQALLAELDAGLAALRQSLQGHERERDVVTLVYSEFGRRVAANGSEGTDHGTAGNVLLLGHRVKGGMHGDMPSLTDLAAGDLKVTTDFRSVYAAVLDRVLGADVDRVLGSGHPSAIGVLA